MGKAVELLAEIRDLLAKDNTPLLMAEQAAAFLGMSRSSLERAECAGKIPPAVQSPAGPRWRREDLLAWIKKLPARRKKPRRRIVVSADSTSA